MTGAVRLVRLAASAAGAFVLRGGSGMGGKIYWLSGCQASKNNMQAARMMIVFRSMKQGG